MKIRTGFVSNSSSSSFTCNVSGETIAGYDGEYEEDVCYANCGHQFLKRFLLKEIKEKTLEEKREILIGKETDKNEKKLLKTADEETINDMFEEIEYENEGYSEELCPICQFKVISKDDMVDYLLKEVVGKTGNAGTKLLEKKIKSSFKDYEEFSKHVK